MADERVWIEHEGEDVGAETEAARLFRINGGKVWLPKSQIGEETGTNEHGEIEIPEWLAVGKGIE